MSLDPKSEVLEKMDAGIAAELSVLLKDQKYDKDLDISALQERIKILVEENDALSEEITTLMTSGINFDYEQLATTFANMDAKSAADTLARMFYMDREKTVKVFAAMDTYSRSLIFNEMDSYDSAEITQGLLDWFLLFEGGEKMSIAINSSTNFTNSVEGKNMTKGSEQGEDLSVEFNQLLSNLVSSDDKNVLNLDNELMNWFNELTDMEQQVIYDIFYSSLTENTTSLVEMQNFISHPTFQSIQSIDLLENQNRMQKLFDFLGKNQTKIESFMQNLSDEEIQNFLYQHKRVIIIVLTIQINLAISCKNFFDFQKIFL